MADYGVKLGLTPLEYDGEVMVHSREPYLEAMTEFLANQAEFKSQIDLLIHALDHFRFGTALPMISENLYSKIIENAKKLCFR